MRIQWTTLFGIRQNIKTNIWQTRFDIKSDKETILRHFNRIFKGELEREIRIGLGNNPYRFKSIPPIEISKNKDNQSYEIINDYDGFVAALLVGLSEEFDGEKLCFSWKNRGFDCGYFCFLKSGNKDNVEIDAIVKGKYQFNDFPNQNIRRLISILFEREFPIVKMWLPKPGIENDDDILVDYPSDERKEMLQYKYKKYPGRQDYEEV